MGSHRCRLGRRLERRLSRERRADRRSRHRLQPHTHGPRSEHRRLGEHGGRYSWAQWTGAPTDFSHGTHTAGIAAAPDNAIGTIGIAPEAKLLLVRVLDDSPGERNVRGRHRGHRLRGRPGRGRHQHEPRRVAREGRRMPGEYTAKDVQELKNAVSRATTYAYQQGTTVVASAGTPRSTSMTTTTSSTCRRWRRTSSRSPRRLRSAGRRASRPQERGTAPSTTWRATRTSGSPVFEFAAPGGDASYPGNENCTARRGPLTRPCFVFDFVLAPGTGGPGVNGNFFAAGTSMAAPHVTGVAAIIIGKNGGNMTPAQVEAALRAVRRRHRQAGERRLLRGRPRERGERRLVVARFISHEKRAGNPGPLVSTRRVRDI